MIDQYHDLLLLGKVSFVSKNGASVNKEESKQLTVIYGGGVRYRFKVGNEVIIPSLSSQMNPTHFIITKESESCFEISPLGATCDCVVGNTVFLYTPTGGAQV